MAINCYSGLQGSGKSYEVVSSVLLDAIQHGRRVVTNVDGIDQDKIHDYLAEHRNADPAKLGEVVHIKNERITQPGFFPAEEKPEVESVVQGGDLVAIDEAWRFWGTDNGKLSHEHMQFFRMHRHYVHPDTHVACDVALMTQDISGLHRSLKNVIEFSFRMVKLKSLGFDKRYRVEIYEGCKQNSKTRLDERVKKYNPAIFPLYQSYAGGKGQENAIDSRQNILANTRIWLWAAFYGVLIIIGAWNGWRFFHRSSPAAQASPDTKQIAGKPDAPVIGKPAAAQPGQPTLSDKPATSEKWRLVGRYQAKGDAWVVVADAAGRLRVESPSMFQGQGLAAIGDIDGERVTHWTGGQPSNPIAAAEVKR